MSKDDDRLANAIRVARMYYYQDMTTEHIAQEMNVSRSKVSRLLSFAKAQGLIEIRIKEPHENIHQLEREIQQEFGVSSVNVVSVSELSSERDRLDRVALFTAKYLNTFIASNTTLALAWGSTVSAIARNLIPKPSMNVNVVQLNGAGNTQSTGISYAGEIVMRFADNYKGQPHLFPVPTFFDYPETKAALWRERSIQRILQLQAQADVLLYSIGAVEAGVPSHVYSGGYLEPEDYEELRAHNVVGDIATVMFRADGTYRDIPLNQRASGPELELFRQAKRAVCVVSGVGKVKGLRATLQGKYLSDLIVDEPTARVLLNN